MLNVPLIVGFLVGINTGAAMNAVAMTWHRIGRSDAATTPLPLAVLSDRWPSRVFGGVGLALALHWVPYLSNPEGLAYTWVTVGAVAAVGLSLAALAMHSPSWLLAWVVRAATEGEKATKPALLGRRPFRGWDGADPEKYAPPGYFIFPTCQHCPSGDAFVWVQLTGRWPDAALARILDEAARLLPGAARSHELGICHGVVAAYAASPDDASASHKVRRTMANLAAAVAAGVAMISNVSHPTLPWMPEAARSLTPGQRAAQEELLTGNVNVEDYPGGSADTRYWDASGWTKLRHGGWLAEPRCEDPPYGFQVWPWNNDPAEVVKEMFEACVRHGREGDV